MKTFEEILREAETEKFNYLETYDHYDNNGYTDKEASEKTHEKAMEHYGILSETQDDDISDDEIIDYKLSNDNNFI
jgi:hypothetical protein